MIIFVSSIYGQSTFKNPIVRGMNPDPSICRVGDDFYLVTSTFEYYPGLPIYKSKDLVNWKMIGYVLDRPSNCPMAGAGSSGGNYAPTIRYNNGTFYVICTNYGGQGSQGVFYVTSKNPEGPWSEPVWVKNWYVDPSLSFDDDSIYYLSPDNNGSFLLGTINPSTGLINYPLKKIASGLGGASPEGPHLYKINGYYYLFSAEGGTGDQHRQVIQRSKNPYGPYEPSPVNPVISHKDDPNNPFQAIGHADLVQLKDGSWWLVCLGYRPKGGNFHHLGRETFLAPVTWDANGWPKGGDNGIIKEELPLPKLPKHVWEKEPVRDNFDNKKLALLWNFVRNPYDADWSIIERAGYLRLKGSKVSLKDKDAPAFIARRQSAFNMVASTKISFKPIAANEEAGLAIRGDDANHYDFVISMRAGKKVVLFRKYLQDKIVDETYKEISSADNILRISSTDLEYKFWIQEEGKSAVLIGSATTKDLSTEVRGGFIGVFIGMYASGNGNVNKNPADFDWFDYEEEPVIPYTWSVGSKTSNAPEIVSISSPSFDKMKIVWNNSVSNSGGYIIEKYINDAYVIVGNVRASDTTFTDSNLVGNTMYVYRVKTKNNTSSMAISSWTMPKPGPFFEKPLSIPGKIEAENYDYGLSGTVMNDNDSENKGGKYRNEGVDIGGCWDTGGGYAIGWIDNGEWLLYSVDVNEALVDIEIRVLTWWNSGAHAKLVLDGTVIAETDIAHTEGQWKTITLKNVKLEKGQNKKLKLVFDKGGFDLNWINFIKSN